MMVVIGSFVSHRLKGESNENQKCILCFHFVCLKRRERPRSSCRRLKKLVSLTLTWHEKQQLFGVFLIRVDFVLLLTFLSYVVARLLKPPANRNTFWFTRPSWKNRVWQKQTSIMQSYDEPHLRRMPTEWRKWWTVLWCVVWGNNIIYIWK